MSSQFPHDDQSNLNRNLTDPELVNSPSYPEVSPLDLQSWQLDLASQPVLSVDSFLDFKQPEIHVTGMNSALKRLASPTSQATDLLERPGSMPRWKPFWPKVNTLGFTFPAGIEFLPPKKEPGEETHAIKPPVPREVDPNQPQKKAVRVKPPADALSIEDRLFYVLQPPLESWLRGQELVMPFEPFPYQYEGIAWLFSQDAALLADEMGLGKTMQTITAIRLLLRSGKVRRILLVCPKPLIPNWQRELKFWAEEIPVNTIEGDGPRRQMMWNMPGSAVMLANYELVVRDYQAMQDGPLPEFDLVVLDEAQRIKNRGSSTAQMIHSIPRKRSLCLTGTPIENRAEELISLFEFMKVLPADSSPDVRQLSKMSEEFILRRTKDLVMKDMPPRLDKDEIIDLSPAQRAAYQIAEKEGIIQLNNMGDSITVQHVFELVLRLKQICNVDVVTGESSKLDRLLADMEEISASGGKAILFSQWTKTIDWLAERTKQFGCLVYHGGVPTPKREPILSQFKEDPNSHLILMSYGTGAVGLNLQFAGYVFLYDRWWNPAIEDQAINRAHRIGQKSQVIVSRLICKDTIEERIDLVLRQKRELFNRVLGDPDNEDASLSLSASEIFGLFDLRARAGNKSRPISPPKPKTDAA
ncbi:DEAD/DEAH box helicase [Planctomicrobium sp. SH668]|uniref:DEAD/DEAH box helicase n=1 Tax=Planctomicrobium sp. SH668 TaxID=3448126 RepID=UPI003F5B686A